MSDDYTKLIEEARTVTSNLRSGAVVKRQLLARLVDAVEALLERVGCDHLDAPYGRVLAERDALQAQLASMTPQWTYGTDHPILPAPKDRRAAERIIELWPEHEYRLWRSLSGPWAPVEGEQA